MPTLDTSFIIDLIRHEPGALKVLEMIEQEGLTPATTPITILELFRGAYLSSSPEKNKKEIEAITEHLLHQNIVEETYGVFGALSARLRGDGRPVGDFDELIAAIALCYDGEIVTRDHHFERIPGLVVRRY
ncbi:putative nucleic acid-binding protein [Methanocalculus alkaliphilus]|uniref:type II toxin-antitoxin system VapC family toxin n=1 Tax=Methanocalculus alkaliphilus TaxID=768730 RepID=UPI00209E6F6E|nr:type II toxin-antitoxin system VapC family toxin [Methanocalculus alkaliphilus]MCP1716264.1 putative nucleic acid-binding protein [Methanocalculus alkaliphilus]